MRESFDRLVARMNASGFFPPPDPTGNGKGARPTMAREFKLPKNQTYEFKPAKAQGTRYDWDDWFNGKLILLERSEFSDTEMDDDGEPLVTKKKDYDVETQAMPPKIKVAARNRYKVCQVGRVDHTGARLKDALIIQARDMTDDERVAEDILRAEEKAAAKEAKTKKKAASATATDSNGQAAPTDATAPAAS